MQSPWHWYPPLNLPRYPVKKTLYILLLIILTACSTTPPPIIAPLPTATTGVAATTIPTIEPSPTPNYNPTSRYNEPGDYVYNMVVEGVPRAFLIHIPPTYVPGELIPLVINLHGLGLTASQQENFSQMHAKADAEGFVVATPQALHNPSTWWPVKGEKGDQDRSFIRAIITYLTNEISIDPAKVFVAGYSNGGAMANSIGCDLSDIVSAIAIVSGEHVTPDICQATHPVSVFAIHGKADHIFPYEGKPAENGGRELYAPHKWMENWAKRNNCNPNPVITEPYPTITLETWENCDEGVEVSLLLIEDGEHSWPTTRYGTKFGDITLYIDATDQIWDFFKAHPRERIIQSKVSQNEVSQSEASQEESPSENTKVINDYRAIKSEGLDRTFLVHIPPNYDPNTPTPLVLNFHGLGANGFAQQSLTQFDKVANQEGFITVYPQASGSPSTWGDFPLSVEDQYPGLKVNDAQFIRDLLADIQSEWNIDPHRIYATGMSNGGGMANRLACDLADQIAAIAPVAGGYYYWEDCAPARPIAVIAFHGKRDEIIPYNGAKIPNYTDLPDIPTWAKTWAERNECNLEPAQPLGDGAIALTAWSDCTQGADVELYTLALGGHQWPYNVLVDNKTANELIWEFFAAHPMP